MNARMGLIDRAQTLESQRYADLAQLVMGMSGLNSGGLQLSGTNMANASSAYGNASGSYGNIVNQWGQMLQGLGLGTGYQQGGGQQPVGINIGQSGTPAPPAQQSNQSPYPYYGWPVGVA